MSDGGIESKFLMSIDISFEPPVVATPGLVVINVTGGSFEGPQLKGCLLYTSPSPRDRQKSRMPSSA